MRYRGCSEKNGLKSVADEACVSLGEDKNAEGNSEELSPASSRMQLAVHYLEKQILNYYANKLRMTSTFSFDLQLFLAVKHDRVIAKVSHLADFVKQHLYFFSVRYTSTMLLLIMMLRDYLTLEGDKEKTEAMDVSLLRMIDSLWLFQQRDPVIDFPYLFISLVSNGLVMVHSMVTQLSAVSLLEDRLQWEQCFNVNAQLLMLNSPVCLTALTVDCYIQSQRYFRSLWNEHRQANSRPGLLPYFRLLIPISKEGRVKENRVHLAQITPYVNKIGYLSHCLPDRIKHVFLFDDQWETGLKSSYQVMNKQGSLDVLFQSQEVGHASFEFAGRVFHLLAPSQLSSIELAGEFLNNWVRVLEGEWSLALDVDRTLMADYKNSKGEACCMSGVSEGEIPFEVVVKVARRANATVILTNGAAYRHSLKGYRRALQHYTYTYQDIELSEPRRASFLSACRLM